MLAQQMEQKSGHFQGQLEAFIPERDQPYGTPKSDGQWRWERDGSKVSNPMTAKMFNEGKIVSWTSFLSLNMFVLTRGCMHHCICSLILLSKVNDAFSRKLKYLMKQKQKHFLFISFFPSILI